MEVGLAFGKRLKHARNLKGLTQKQAAEEFGITKVGYQNYEYGRRAPALEFLPRIATFFNVSLDYLLGRTDEPQMPDAETWKLIRQLQAYKAKEQEKEQSND